MVRLCCGWTDSDNTHNTFKNKWKHGDKFLFSFKSPSFFYHIQAANFYRDLNRISNHNYFTKRNIVSCGRTTTACTFDSFIPPSIRTINKQPSDLFILLHHWPSNNKSSIQNRTYEICSCISGGCHRHCLPVFPHPYIREEFSDNLSFRTWVRSPKHLSLPAMTNYTLYIWAQ